MVDRLMINGKHAWPLGEYMASERAAGRYDYDCRYDLADAAKIGKAYFDGFHAALNDALKTAR